MNGVILGDEGDFGHFPSFLGIGFKREGKTCPPFKKNIRDEVCLLEGLKGSSVGMGVGPLMEFPFLPHGEPSSTSSLQRGYWPLGEDSDGGFCEFWNSVALGQCHYFIGQKVWCLLEEGQETQEYPRPQSSWRMLRRATSRTLRTCWNSGTAFRIPGKPGKHHQDIWSTQRWNRWDSDVVTWKGSGSLLARGSGSRTATQPGSRVNLLSGVFQFQRTP